MSSEIYGKSIQDPPQIHPKTIQNSWKITSGKVLEPSRHQKIIISHKNDQKRPFSRVFRTPLPQNFFSIPYNCPKTYKMYFLSIKMLKKGTNHHIRAIFGSKNDNFCMKHIVFGWFDPPVEGEKWVAHVGPPGTQSSVTYLIKKFYATPKWHRVLS